MFGCITVANFRDGHHVRTCRESQCAKSEKTHNYLMRWPISFSGFHLIAVLCLCGFAAQARSGIPPQNRFDPRTLRIRT